MGGDDPIAANKVADSCRRPRERRCSWKWLRRSTEPAVRLPYRTKPFSLQRR
jgi:hypothetical protein